MITAKIFRAYDIRGIYNKDFDLQGAEDIGKGYGTYLLRTSNNLESLLRVCVGRDGRIHGNEIEGAFIRGLQSTGIQVVDINLCFSPLLFFSLCKDGFDGGVVITASHNPKEYNGFKLQRENAHAICGEEIQKILALIETQDFIQTDSPLEIQEKYYWEDYCLKVLATFPMHQGIRIVIDAGNGITGMFAPELFKKLGYEVIELYCEVDGNFPNHQPDPEEKKNLADLQMKVIESGAQFGIAFDGDGDRVGIVDHNGVIYEADYLLALLAKDILTRYPGTPIVKTVTSSGFVDETIEKYGGTIVESKVGHSFVEEKMRESGALVGGESSGHLFFTENYYGFDDGIWGAVKILDLVLSSKKSLKEHFSDIVDIFTSPEIKFEVADEQKFALIEKIKSHFLNTGKPCNTIDGVKVDFGERAWGICRASNTSPKISIRAEARSRKKMEMIIDEFTRTIERYLT